MEVQKSTEKSEAEKFGSTASRIHNFSTVHGSLPADYVPEWKRNVEFRNENIRLAKDYGIAWSTHGDTSFLGKRERLEDSTRNAIIDDLERVDAFPVASHMSKYNSSMLHRRLKS